MKSIGSLECRKINNSLFVIRKVISVLAYNHTLPEELRKPKVEMKKSTIFKQQLISGMNDRTKDKKALLVP